MVGGIQRNEAHPMSSLGNLMGVIRSTSSTTCFEMMGRRACVKQAARITPAAPVGEFRPARIALVSRNTLGALGIPRGPDGLSGLFGGTQKSGLSVT